MHDMPQNIIDTVKEILGIFRYTIDDEDAFYQSVAASEPHRIKGMIYAIALHMSHKRNRTRDDNTIDKE